MADYVVYTIPGRNPLSGMYAGHQGVLQFYASMPALGRAGSLDVLDVAANDTYAYVQIHDTASRDGHSYEFYGVHL